MAFTVFAAIDIGSYELEMKIYQISEKQGIIQLDDVRHRLDLGKDVYRIGRISPALLEELCDTLKSFVKIMEGYQVDACRACATSAIREAGNRLNVIDQIRQQTGLQVEVLSNPEQRYLSYEAIASKVPHFAQIIEKGTLIVDIGGGSLQLSLYDKDNLVASKSIPYGFVRIRETLAQLVGEVTSPAELVEELIEDDVHKFQKLYIKNHKIPNIIAIGDYANDIMKRANPITDDTTSISREEFMETFDNIRKLNYDELANFFDIPYENTGFILPSAIVYRTLIDITGAEKIYTPGITLSDGLAYDYASRKKLIVSQHDFSDDILTAAINIGKHYQVSKKHTSAVDGFAREIFDQLRETYDLGKRDRLLLRVAIALHDCGKYIALQNSSSCAYDIIRHTEIMGIALKEREIIAHIVRCQFLPIAQIHDLSKELDPRSYLLVEKLTAIFRIADALDSTHRHKVTDLTARLEKDSLILDVKTMENMAFEQGKFKENVSLFEEVFGLVPVLRINKNQ